MEFGRQVGRNMALDQPERVQIRREVAAHAIGPDEHHRADAVFGGAADFIGAGAGRGDLIRDGRLDFLDRRLSRVEAEVELVELGDRPVRPRPARPGFAFDHSDGVVHATL